MKREFEEYFPLPWKITKEKDIVLIKGQGWDIPVIIAEGSAAECAEREALRYAVQCANLMPEAVEVIKDLVKIVSQPDYDPDSLDYADYVVRRAEELLAKLEGGNDNEPR